MDAGCGERGEWRSPRSTRLAQSTCCGLGSPRSLSKQILHATTRQDAHTSTRCAWPLAWQCDIYSVGLASCMAASPSAPQTMCTCQHAPKDTSLPCPRRLQLPPSLDTHAHTGVFRYLRPCSSVKSARHCVYAVSWPTCEALKQQQGGGANTRKERERHLS